MSAVDKSNDPVDPPMEPREGAQRWAETGPGAILNDPDLATLIVRIGMATNALSAQIHAGKAAAERLPAAKTRDILCSLVTSAALTNEAIKVVSGGMSRLRPLALRAGASEELLQRIGQLCAGKHPADGLLKRARNEIGFHWDQDTIGPSVREFGKNRKLIWIEADTNGEYVHRLACEVLVHALFPEAQQQDSDGTKLTLEQEMKHLSSAMDLIIEFCVASAWGYMRACQAVLKTKENDGAEKGGL